MDREGGIGREMEREGGRRNERDGEGGREREGEWIEGWRDGGNVRE